MAAVFAMWHGGPSYAPGYVDTDTEEFASLAAARDAMESRYFNRDGRTPAVEEDAMWLWFSDPRGVSDPYPDRILERGPRGGIRMTPA